MGFSCLCAIFSPVKSFTNKQIRYLIQDFLISAEKARNLREVDDLLELILKSPPLHLKITLFLVSGLVALGGFFVLALFLALEIATLYLGWLILVDGLLFVYACLPIHSHLLLRARRWRLSRTLHEKNLFFAQKTKTPLFVSSKWRKYEKRFVDFRRGCEHRRRGFAWVGTKNLEKKGISLVYDLYEFHYLQRREKRSFDIRTRKWTNESQILPFARSGIIFPLFPHKGNLVLGRYPILSLVATPLPWRASLPSSERVFSIWKDEQEFSFLDTPLLKKLAKESEGLELLQIEVREGSLLISTASPLMTGKRSFGVEDKEKFQRELMSVRYLPKLRQLENILVTLLGG